MIPKFLKCQKVYYPTPLATLTKMTIQLQRPNGNLVSDTLDTLDISGIFASTVFTSYTSNSIYVNSAVRDSASNATYYIIRTKTYFNRFAFAKNDRIRIQGVNTDLIAGNGAHIPEKLRLEGVIANSYVDSAFIFNEDIYSLIMRLKPDIIVKGKEHENQNNPELIAVKNYGGKLLFCSGESLLSSVDLLKREFNSTVFNSIGLPSNYLLRHSISNKDLIKLVQSFAKLHVCVIGDLIVDEYITCQSLGMSQEDPTIVVTPIDEKKFIGGAAIVAAHAVKMGAITDFVSVVGCDEVADYARECLNMHGLNPFLLNDDSRPTTLKRRYRSKGKSLLRVSYLHQNAISNTLKN
ncbi:MAG: hypothetical protein EBS33_05350, partial [Alphaproteobacteria bacterium]|nr:hypothetical protein [Alphaproteobacteria bacterium]